MESTIYRFIIRYSLRQQIILTIMAGLSFPFLYALYEVPKIIINKGISAKGIEYPTDIFGIELTQIQYLLALCGLFLVLVVINQAFKYVINVYRGLTGERMLRRLRFQLYFRLLRFPLPTFRKMSQGEIIPMITQEVETLGGFIGDAFSLPAFQGGTLLVILGFLLVQDPVMAAAAVALYPLQAFLIPRLQRQVNLLGKERVRLVRRLSDRIGETVQGVQEVHAHDTSALMLSDFSHRMSSIFFVRFDIYQKKFVIKFLNNFIQQLGPFFFYSIGGYLVITGSLEIGTLVAAIAAHKDMAAPWKELLTYYQQKEDARIKYEQVIEQFSPSGIAEDGFDVPHVTEVPPLSEQIVVSNLGMVDEQDNPFIEGVSLQLKLPSFVALVGPSGSGREELALALARLRQPDSGSIRIGDIDLANADSAMTGRRISYVGPSGFIFNTTLGDNLFYSLRHLPLGEPERDETMEQAHKRYVQEAIRSGNSPDDITSDWTDYAAAGATDYSSLVARGLQALAIVSLDQDVYQFGLRSTIDPVAHPDWAEAILKARESFARHVASNESYAGMIEPFDVERYNSNATLAENLMFGTPTDETFDINRLAENPYVLEVLEEAGLTRTLLENGYEVATLMVELFADLPPDHEFFQQYSFIAADDLEDFQSLVTRVKRDRLDDLKPEERTRLLSLPFKLIQARHRLGVISDETMASIVTARKIFAEKLPDDLKGKVAFFDVDSYNAASNIQDNILFGRIAYGQAQASDKIGALVGEVVAELDLYDTITSVGLGFEVGIAGTRLNVGQRQKLALARAIIKRPDLLIISEATAALDSATQQKIMASVLEEFKGRSVVWSLHRPKDAKAFDHVVVLQGGRIVEQGPFQDLDRDGSAYRQLIAAS
ncbi:ABC transporter transmembrane domain-containing protein [Oceanibacterium hippocampi]|uniref:Heterocyst differentiation ATP-binding protein HepA n=1 Tax=Oceanibacterium hippocampi TaxID=745714 RepID=A0A1Y5RPX3_9PROT|nr:ABC transporter ATP-binding protein/permease [Oceanibacterium hippocampi]SLN19860.1 Heterocyst differentiation ATP-binding protein HepA [Oceanibacterium hippocampi]